MQYQITPEIVRQFTAEVAERLDELERALMALERAPGDRDAIHAAFRAVHSIKGNSDYIGIGDIHALSQGFEDLMDVIRSGRMALTEAALSVLFEGLDVLRGINRRIADGDDGVRDVSPILERIKRLGTEEAAPAGVAPRAEMDVAGVFARSSAQHIAYIREVTGRILAGQPARGAKRNVMRVLRTFRTAANYVGAGHIATVLGDMEAELEGVRSIRKKAAGALLNRLREVETAVAAMGRVAAGGEGDAGFGSDILDREIRVAPEKVDAFMNQVSELAIAGRALNDLVERLLTAGHAPPDTAAALRRAVAGMDRLAGVLQAGAMDLRLVRLNALFERLPRIVRDLSLRSRKQIELSVLGGETEIDRKVIEQLVGPMVHLIRNAVDHGIEPPAERLRKGKSETGAVTVQARHEGGRAVIEVIDDGLGLRVDTIRKTALARGLATADAIESMSDGEALNLIFLPGFSTSAEVTSVSGRGVGLDVVRNNVKQVGGSVIVESEPDVATRVRLVVPISIAVMDALLAEAAGECYAFPFSSVLENITVSQGEVQVLNRREAIPYRGAVLPLRRLEHILGIGKTERLRALGSNQALPVIVLAFGGQMTGIVVDRIAGREGILTKPLDRHLAGIREFSGAAVLGDGRIVLVLDPMGLF